MTAFAADHVLDGGGLANFSANVADVGATGAIGIYDIHKVDVTTVAIHSRAVTAGSMRCYGTLQTMTALEAYGPFEVRDELSMNDFPREYLGLTGTKFGCGAAQCLSCAVIVDNPDGSSQTSPTCVVPAASFTGKSIRTVEGHARNGELSVLQKAFVEHFSFQCGYCTPGFLNESQVLLERLAKTPVARADLDKTILDALDGFAAAPGMSNIMRPCGMCDPLIMS